MSKNKYILSSLFVGLFLLIYARLIINDPILNYDDQLIIGPLTKVDSINNYINYVQKGIILDLQPLRDLSHFLDIKLKLIFPYYSFHLMNLLIWFVIVYFFNKILKNFEKNIELNRFKLLLFTALYAFSPIWISSVAWIAARKHLLSTLFIFVCTSELTKLEKHDLNRRSKFKIFACYFLSLISQPINILWPLWACYYLHVKNKLIQSKRFLSSLLTLMITFAIANYYYFSVFYLKIGFAKYLNFNFYEKISRMFLALGRYFQLVVFPFSALPSPHSEHSPLNIIGMFLFVCFVIFLYLRVKKTPNNKHLLILPLSYFVLHLILLCYNNNIFVSDTYLLNASVGIYLLAYILIKNSKRFFSFLIVYAFSFSAFSFTYIKNFENSKKLWTYSLMKEPTMDSIINEMMYFIASGYPREAYLVGKDEIDSDNVIFLHNYFLSIYLQSDLTLDEKVRMLTSVKKDHPTQNILLSLVYFHQNNFKKFESELFYTFKYVNYYQLWSGTENKILALTSEMCLKTTEKNRCLQELEKSKKDFNAFDIEKFNFYKKYYESLPAEKINYDVSN